MESSIEVCPLDRFHCNHWIYNLSLIANTGQSVLIHHHKVAVESAGMMSTQRVKGRGLVTVGCVREDEVRVGGVGR